MKKPGEWMKKELAHANNQLSDTVKSLIICHHGLHVDEEKHLSENDGITKAKQCADTRLKVNEALGKIRFGAAMDSK